MPSHNYKLMLLVLLLRYITVMIKPLTSMLEQQMEVQEMMMMTGIFQMAEDKEITKDLVAFHLVIQVDLQGVMVHLMIQDFLEIGGWGIQILVVIQHVLREGVLKMLK